MKMDQPYKLIGKIPSELIQELILLIQPEHWLIDTVRNNMTNLQNTESIIFRYFENYVNHRSDNYKNFFVDQEIFNHYRTTVSKFLDEVRKYYEFSDYMAFLAKLKPNSEIGFHKDKGKFLEECHRVHIPIKTNADVFYIIEDVKYNWREGEIYEFDNTRMHGVKNASNDDRIHLLFNLYK